VTDQTGAVGEQLADCRFADLRVQAFHIFANRVVQAQLAGFSQLHDAGGGEALRMRGYAKAMARRQCFAGREISRAVGTLEGGLVAVHDNRDTAGEP